MCTHYFPTPYDSTHIQGPLDSTPTRYQVGKTCFEFCSWIKTTPPHSPQNYYLRPNLPPITSPYFRSSSFEPPTLTSFMSLQLRTTLPLQNKRNNFFFPSPVLLSFNFFLLFLKKLNTRTQFFFFFSFLNLVCEKKEANKKEKKSSFFLI